MLVLKKTLFSNCLNVLVKGGNTGGGCSLAIDATSGVISATSALDYEAASLCTITVKAEDGGTPTALSSTVTVYVIITGVNEFTPTFTGPITGTVLENAAAGEHKSSIFSKYMLSCR